MTVTPNKAASIYTDGFGGATHQLILIDDTTRSSYPFTVNVSTNLITATGHDYVDGTRLNVLLASAGTLPTPLTANTTLWARDCATDVFKVSLTDGGAAIDIIDAGTGTFLVTDIALDYKNTNLAGFVRKEIASYQGQSVRPTATMAATATIGATTVTITGSGVCDNSAGASDITFTAVLTIEGGSTAIGNTTGTLVDYNVQDSPIVVAAGQAKSIPVTFTHNIPNA